MTQVIPLQATPSQIAAVTLDGQACQIEVYQKRSGVYINLYVNNSLIIGGVICENLNRVVRSLYLGFSGDLAFLDNQGSDDPVYTGLGTRWTLMYLTPEELLGQG